MISPSRGRRGLVLILVLLFMALSFNAYACLIPLFGTSAVSMGNGCPTSEDSPVRQFCDHFKTLAVHSPLDSNPDVYCQTYCTDGSLSSSQLLNVRATHYLIYDHPAQTPPQDVLLKTSVLRI